MSVAIAGLTIAGTALRKINEEFFLKDRTNWKALKIPGVLYLLGTWMNPANLPGQKFPEAHLTHIVFINSIACFSRGFNMIIQRNWTEGTAQLVTGSVLAIGPCILNRMSVFSTAMGFGISAISGGASSLIFPFLDF